MQYRKLTAAFFARPCPEAAHDLVGKLLCRALPDGTVHRMRIIQTEAYCGESDTACHAHKGRTARTETLYARPGTLYVYLCYGIHWMLNIVTGDLDDPQAILIRACENAVGPGRLTKALHIDGSFNKKTLEELSDTLWLEDDGLPCQVTTGKRVGIGYASREDQEKPWRYIMT